MRPTRRQLLLGAAGWLAAPALARARPLPRPAAPPSAQAPESLAAIFASSGLGAATGFVVADLATGRVLEAQAADEPRPPASVAKVVTTLYARETLGPDYRFATRLLATGGIAGGRLEGDLVLAGGGDPVLDTDALGDLAAALAVRGLTSVAGRFRVVDDALPAIAEIDPGQPAAAAFNASVSGTNLDFNRVFAAWQPGGAGLAFSAPGERHSAPVAGVRGVPTDAALPSHAVVGGEEVWRLPKDGMRRAGSLWLPVRQPATHAGEVFRTLAGGAGLALPPVATGDAAEGAALAVHQSAPLDRLLADMLRFSTNLTAEAIGLRASQARGLAPADLAASGAAMTAWARGRFGLTQARLVNHSGLSGDARLTPAELVAVLRQGLPLGLAALLPPKPLLGTREVAPPQGVTLVAKTGTLDFVSGLAGYLTTPGRRLVFAILVADTSRRDALTPTERADPPGGAAWLRRARAQEQALLRRWAALHVG